MRSRQQGFAALEAILILVVVAAIGFTGWYVWQTRQNSVDPKKATKASTVSNSTPKYLTYRNKTYHFEFNYPAQWGSVDVQDTSGSSKFKSYNLIFDRMTKMIVGFNEKGWTPTETDNEKSIEFTSCKIPHEISAYSIYTSQDSCLAFVAFRGDDGSTLASLVAQGKLSGKVPAIEFDDAPLAVSGTSPAALKKAFEQSYSTPDTSAAAYVTVLKSMKEN